VPTDLRDKILTAARRVFVDDGFEALTMRRLAKEIGYSPTTIYLHFKDKSEIVKAICDELFLALIKRLQDLARRQTDPVKYLEAGLRAYIDFGLKHPDHYYVTFIAAAGRVEYEFEGSAGQQAFGCLRDAVQACATAGRLRPLDVDATAQTLWAATHGLISLLITDRHFPFLGRQRLVDQLVGTLMAGIATA
jgi:AcrR family transcriptional regulator